VIEACIYESFKRLFVIIISNNLNFKNNIFLSYIFIIKYFKMADDYREQLRQKFRFSDTWRAAPEEDPKESAVNTLML